MKLNKLIYGVLSCFCLFSCADQMEYKEYSNYDADYGVRPMLKVVCGLLAIHK